MSTQALNSEAMRAGLKYMRLNQAGLYESLHAQAAGYPAVKRYLLPAIRSSGRTRLRSFSSQRDVRRSTAGLKCDSSVAAVGRAIANDDCTFRFRDFHDKEDSVFQHFDFNEFWFE